MSERGLLDEWPELLARRATFRDTLAAYEPLLAAWAAWPADRVAPLALDRTACHAVWRRGIPLLASAAPALDPVALEPVVGAGLDFLAAAGEDLDAIQRFAEAWDRREVEPRELFPEAGRLGAAPLQARLGLSHECLGFLAYAALRPALGAFFRECRAHVADAPWDLGVCPFCGAPPGFSDVLEEGPRRLSCHVCGGGFRFVRLQCCYCGSRDARDVVRLQAEEKEEGYAIVACRSCRGYLKELDRRLRWNGGSALVEDWGSPHLDVVARRAGYWRAVPTLIDLRPPAPE